MKFLQFVVNKNFHITPFYRSRFFLLLVTLSRSLLLHYGVKERSTKEWNGEHWELRFEIIEQNSRIFFDWDGSGNVPYHTFKWEPDFCHFCCLMTWSRLYRQLREIYIMQKISSPHSILRSMKEFVPRLSRVYYS